MPNPFFFLDGEMDEVEAKAELQAIEEAEKELEEAERRDRNEQAEQISLLTYRF